MMLADKIGAAEAEQMGMIYKSIADDQFDEQSWALALKLASRPTVGLGLTKRLLNESYHNTLEDQLKREGDEQIAAASSKDYKEGVQAFLEKRKPTFTGE